MSGFEVAGVVLGSIPLLISTLEHYSDGVSALQRWRRYERELRCLIRNLQTERVKLTNVCEKLLVGLVPSSKIESMIKNPGGAEWRTEDIRQRIKARLWEACDVFDDIIQDVKLAIDEMEKRLGSQNDGKVSELRRGIFTLRRSRYDDLLTIIKDGIANLENLTDRNIELEPSRRIRSQVKLFRILRGLANSLYRALQSSLACGCKHDLGIKLERRTVDITPIDEDERIICELAFQFVVSSLSRSEILPTRTWQKVLVKATPPPPPSPLPSPSPRCDPQQLPPLYPARIQQRRPRTRKTVSFGFSQLSTMASTTTTLGQAATHTSVARAIHSLNSTMESIVLSNITTTINLCENLQKVQQCPTAQGDASCGIIIDQHLSKTCRKYNVYHVLQPTDFSLLSLHRILEHKDKDNPIPYPDQLHLAAVISSNLLQFHSTSWVPEALDSHQIFFIVTDDGPIYSHPFFLKLKEPLNSTQPSSTADGSATCVLDRDPKLLSLGLLLIELILGQTLDSLKTGTGPGIFPEGSLGWKYVIAQSVLPRVKTKSLNYYTAVVRCIDGDFHSRRAAADGTGLDSESLCEEVYSGVVALLEKDYENSSKMFA